MVKIISDSTSDLSQDLLDRYNTTLVPLIVRLGDQQYEDRVNITSEEIFRWSDSTKKAPTTACANVWTIQEVFQHYLSLGSQNGFRMKLDSFNIVFPMTEAHNHAVI